MSIAYASNLGGLTVRHPFIIPLPSRSPAPQTPIASPQNLLGFSTINTPYSWAKQNDTVSSPLSWGLFLGVTIPFSLVSLAMVWGFLWVFYRPKLKEVDAIPQLTPSPIGIYHVIIMVRTLVSAPPSNLGACRLCLWARSCCGPSRLRSRTFRATQASAR